MNESLFKEMYWACKAAEAEWRCNEKHLEMERDALIVEKQIWLKLLADPSISDEEFCKRMRNYYEIVCNK